jgi:hypothetical protein
MRLLTIKGEMLQPFCDHTGLMVAGPDLTIPLCCIASVRHSHPWNNITDVVTFTSAELYGYLCQATRPPTDSEPDSLQAGDVIRPTSDTPSEDSWCSGKDDSEILPDSDTEFRKPGKKRRASADLVPIDRSQQSRQ